MERLKRSELERKKKEIDKYSEVELGGGGGGGGGGGVKGGVVGYICLLMMVFPFNGWAHACEHVCV